MERPHSAAKVVALSPGDEDRRPRLGAKLAANVVSLPA